MPPFLQSADVNIIPTMAPFAATPSSSPTASSSGSAALHHRVAALPSPPLPPPPPREVAAGVSNLGNTCYMNAALQALAHAPELCHALDTESHVRRCPVALRNQRGKRRRRVELMKRKREEEDEHKRRAAGDATGDGGKVRPASSPSSDETHPPAGREGNRKKRGKNASAISKRGRGAGGSSAESGGLGSGGGSDGSGNDVDEFCTLCEVERLMGRVHFRPEEVLEDPLDGAKNSDGRDGVAADCGGNGEADPSSSSSAATVSQDAPVVPEAFVAGFMSQVAPWFKRGVQEDSHEFLRLLIDAMQNSCKLARGDKIKNCGGNGDSTTSSKKGVATKKKKKKKKNEEEEEEANDDEEAAGGDGPPDEDTEYPFRLFRGTVESNVKCSSCPATSRKIDPIEDVGLDILPVARTAAPAPTGRRGASSSSRAASPVHSMALADVQQALERFISEERLDSGYRCEKCGKPGKATKTSRLASIPPILTLHLKRFRYGSITAVEMASMGGAIAGGTGRSKRSRDRSGPAGGGGPSLYGDPSLSGGGSVPDLVGSSGSAKIEGHVRFRHILDIRPYLTPELQSSVFRKAFCRLFAVVVHTGKNSHSGHYVAYVCNLTRNEWWKMDDSKVERASWGEVERAEAYMLFYRVMDHPVAKQLKADAEAKAAAAARETAKAVAEAKKASAEAEAEAKAKRADEEAAATAAAVCAGSEGTQPAGTAAADRGDGGGALHPPDTLTAPSGTRPSNRGAKQLPPPPATLGKRKRPELATGGEWAKAQTSLSPEYYSIFQRIQEFINENVAFEPEFFRYITEEYNRLSSQLCRGGEGGAGSNHNQNRGGGGVTSGGNSPKIESLLTSGPGGVYPPGDVRDGAADFHEGILDLFHQISIMHKSSSSASDRKDSGGGGVGFLLSPPPTATTGLDQGTGPAVATAVVVEEEEPLPPTHARTPSATAALAEDDELIIPDSAERYDGAL